MPQLYRLVEISAEEKEGGIRETVGELVDK